MAYLYNFPNGTTPDVILPQVASQITWLVPGLLFFVFCVIFIGGSSRQKNRGYQADYPMWGTVAGISTFMLSLVFGMVSGFISLWQTVITLVITFAFALWLFLDKRPNEV